MKTKTEILKQFRLSPSDLSAALKALGIPDASAFDGQQLEQIEEYLTRPKTPNTDATDATSFELQGLDSDRINRLVNAQQANFIRAAQQGYNTGLMGALVGMAAEQEGYIRLHELVAGTAEPSTKEEQQALQHARAIQDAFVPPLPFGFSQQGGKMTLSLTAIRQMNQKKLTGN